MSHNVRSVASVTGCGVSHPERWQVLTARKLPRNLDVSMAVRNRDLLVECSRIPAVVVDNILMPGEQAGSRDGVVQPDLVCPEQSKDTCPDAISGVYRPFSPSRSGTLEVPRDQ
jgi:hypothetical protein